MTKDNEFTIPATKYSDDEEERLAWLAGGQSGQFKIAEVIYVDRTVKRLTKTVANMPPKEVQAIVGGYVEHRTLSSLHTIVYPSKESESRRYVSMWVNKDAVSKKLPINPEASELACSEGDIPIRGNVIVESWWEVDFML